MYPSAIENLNKTGCMSVALLLVTHGSIGNDMLKVTGTILNEDFFNTACIGIPTSSDTEKMKQRITNALNSLSTSDLCSGAIRSVSVARSRTHTDQRT